MSLVLLGLLLLLSELFNALSSYVSKQCKLFSNMRNLKY